MCLIWGTGIRAKWNRDQSRRISGRMVGTIGAVRRYSATGGTSIPRRSNSERASEPNVSSTICVFDCCLLQPSFVLFSHKPFLGYWSLTHHIVVKSELGSAADSPCLRDPSLHVLEQLFWLLHGLQALLVMPLLHCQLQFLSHLRQSDRLHRGACSEPSWPNIQPSCQGPGTALSGRKSSQEACRYTVEEAFRSRTGNSERKYY